MFKKLRKIFKIMFIYGVTFANSPVNAHTTCTVCKEGLDIEKAYLCNVCSNYVHPKCFDRSAGMCNDCSKAND